MTTYTHGNSAGKTSARTHNSNIWELPEPTLHYHSTAALHLCTGEGIWGWENFAVKKSGETPPQRNFRGVWPTTLLRIQMQVDPQPTRK